MAIRVLPDQLVNQIAAGEVVERPAAVVKELVENSLDAGATRIDVTLDKGGLGLIRVRDDGCGIGRDELAVALSRHATSKIADLDDLEAVASYGFRGEALPSILSVSRMQIISRHDADEEHGWRVGGDGRVESDPVPAPHPPGSTIEVRDLFFNTPARRKFMRTEATEARHVDQLIRRIALARGDVGFGFTQNGRQTLDLRPAPDLERLAGRVSRVCGEAFVDKALAIDEVRGGLRLWGWLALPSFSTSRADQQYFYVNGRPIKDRLVTVAMRRAYADVLHSSRHPAFVLFLELDPAGVDVNVHPAKAEVRFRESSQVHDFIFGTVNRVLRDVRPDPEHHTVSMASDQPTAAESEYNVPDASGAASRAPYHASVPRQMRIHESRPASAWEALPRQTEHAQDAGPDEAPALPMGRALGQVNGVFILAETDDGMIVVDMHAAHERVLFERLKQQLADGAIRSQRLLMPEAIHVSESAAALAEERADWLASMGLEIDREGLTSVVVRGVPPLLLKGDIDGLVRQLLEDKTDDDTDSHFGEVRDAQQRVLADVACRAAIKSGRRLSLPEMDGLLRDMEATENAGQCSHGRPTWVHVSGREMDRLFLRGR